MTNDLTLTALSEIAARPWLLSKPGGRLAQLVERLVYTENVGGSSPSSPTIFLFVDVRICLDNP